MATQQDVKDQLKTDLEVAKQPDGGGRKTIRQMLEDPIQKAEIAKALPNALSPERFTRILLTAINSQPNLMRCDALSLLAAGMQCAALGMEPNTPLQHCWLLPFENRREERFDVQFVLGYQGMIELALRSPQVLSVAAKPVYANDVFEYDEGVADLLIHKRDIDGEKGPIRCYYALAHLIDGGHYWRINRLDEIEEHRQMSKSPNSPAWRDHPLPMALKTCVRIAWPYIPKSAEAAAALHADESVGRYDQWFDPDGKAIDTDARESAPDPGPPLDQPVSDGTEPPAADIAPCKECKGVGGQHSKGCPEAPFE